MQSILKIVFMYKHERKLAETIVYHFLRKYFYCNRNAGNESEPSGNCVSCLYLETII